jgi:hypothetical protein
MKKSLILRNFLIASLITFAFLGVVGVQATSDTPVDSELDVQLTYFSPYNSEYKLADSLITGNTVDMLFLEGLRTNTKLDLGKSVWESTFSTVANNNEYSLTMGNNTYDTATSDGMTVNTQATANSAETLITFKATTNASAVAQYAQALSYFSWDGNDDGDYADTADRHYLPHDENIFLVINNEMTTDGTDAQTYSTIEIVLETTTSTDYSIILKYWYTSGDSGWDYSTSNGATLEFFDCSGIPVVTTVDVAGVLEADTGESHNILGTDYIKQYLYEDVASKYVQNELKNIGYYSSMPAFTDKTDDNSNWDFDGSDEYFTGIDATDYLFTVITQSTTDTYDSSQEFLIDQSGTISTIIPARYLYFSGVMAVYPMASSSWSSGSAIVSGKYLTTESLVFDTREINDLDSLANVLSVSTWKFNTTLEDEVMWDKTNYENNIVSFTWDGIDNFQTFKTAWTTSTDDSEVQFDSADPSTTTGSLQNVVLSYYTDEAYSAVVVSATPDGGTVSTASQDNSQTIVILALIVGLGIGVWYWKKD